MTLCHISQLHMQTYLMSAGDRAAASSPTLTHYWLGAEEYTGNCRLCMTSCRHTVYRVLRHAARHVPAWKVLSCSSNNTAVRTRSGCHGKAACKGFACKSKTNSIEVEFPFKQNLSKQKPFDEDVQMLCRLCLGAQGRKAHWETFGCLTLPADNGHSQQQRVTPQHPEKCTLAQWWMRHAC